MEIIKALVAILDAGMTRISALVLTATLVGTIIWPFMPDGFWDKLLKWGYLGMGIVFLYLIIPIIYYGCKVSYYKRKLGKR